MKSEYEKQVERLPEFLKNDKIIMKYFKKFWMGGFDYCANIASTDMNKNKYYKGLTIPEHKGVREGSFSLGGCQAIGARCGDLQCEDCIFGGRNRHRFYEWKIKGVFNPLDQI